VYARVYYLEFRLVSRILEVIMSGRVMLLVSLLALKRAMKNNQPEECLLIKGDAKQLS
jgi:hypothetical protein